MTFKKQRANMKVSLLIGGAGLVMGLVLMFFSMGIPIGSILLAIPVGIITGRLLVRRTKPGEAIPQKLGVQAGLISGTLTALGTVAPLAAIAIMAPKGATISQELSKEINPNLIPSSLNSIPVAMVLAAAISVLLVIGLATTSCVLATRWHQ